VCDRDVLNSDNSTVTVAVTTVFINVQFSILEGKITLKPAYVNVQCAHNVNHKF